MKILMVDDSRFNIMFLAKAIELHLGKDYQIISQLKKLKKRAGLVRFIAIEIIRVYLAILDLISANKLRF